ncbi:hypothetical protein [Haliea sp. E17]|uniref:hypothetical protein n=1 Tax=Haliea sp. E17 TaxID=3401576 RepID=UPI003AAF2CBC
MHSFGERLMVYAALLVLCAMTAIAVNPAAGALSLLQIVVVIELINWLASPADSAQARGNK